MKTAQKINLKRQELDELRRAFGQTLGPRHGMQGVGLGLVFAGFAVGVMVERWGWVPFARRLLSLNQLASFVAPALTPAFGLLNP